MIITWRQTESSKASFILFDMQGALVATLLQDQILAVGEQRLEYPLSNLSAGSYFYELVTERGKTSGKFQIVK